MPDLDEGHGDDQIPRPDPTVRTEERLRREISSVEKSFAKDVDCIKEVLAEKFTAVELSLSNLAESTAEQKTDVKEAVNSALSAAKELVALQNTNTSEALRALGLLIQTQGKADTELLSDLKDRVVRIESQKVGATEAVTTQRAVSTDQRAFVASLVGVGLLVVSVAGVIIALIVAKP